LSVSRFLRPSLIYLSFGGFDRLCFSPSCFLACYLYRCARFGFCAVLSRFFFRVYHCDYSCPFPLIQSSRTVAIYFLPPVLYFGCSSLFGPTIDSDPLCIEVCAIFVHLMAPPPFFSILGRVWVVRFFFFFADYSRFPFSDFVGAAVSADFDDDSLPVRAIACSIPGLALQWRYTVCF